MELVFLLLLLFFTIFIVASTGLLASFERPEIDLSISDNYRQPPEFEEGKLLESQICSANQFNTPAYNRWAEEIKETPKNHRKQWEFIYILKALHERGMLNDGKKGVGFGVGLEPLPAVMAKYGAEVLATDLDEQTASDAGWTSTNQYLNSLEKLNQHQICDKAKFNKLA